jgi:hypothetical protein
MKVSLHEDRIIGFSGDIEIGNMPKGVGLERIRWNGKSVVDLMTLDEIWVRHQRGVFEFHAVSVPESQRVAMTYADRKRLHVESGVIRVRTEQDMEVLKQAEAGRIVDNRSLKAEAIAFASELTYDQIDAHVETIFGSLNTAQKGSLKRLYGAVLFLTKSSV